MKKFTEFMEKSFVPVAAKIGSQRHLVAIRDGFIGIMPITMAGAIAVLINVFVRDLPNKYLVDKEGETSAIAESMAWLIGINGNVWWGTIAMLALMFSFALGYQLAKSYDVNALAGGLVSVASFITVLPQGVPGTWGNIPYAWTNSGGLFTALIMGLITVQIYVFLMKKNVTIKMPDAVPPAVAKAFAAIVPGTIAIYVAGIIQYLFTTNFEGITVAEKILEWVQAPFLELSQGLFSVLVIIIFVQLFWFFGLHGPNVLAPLLEGIYKTALTENTNAYNAGKDLPYIWTRGSFDAYVWMGGSGATITLLIAIFIFSKVEEARAVAKLSFAMGCFNINEPVIFGLPIVLNPIYFIPWMLVPVVMTLIAYFVTQMGLVPPVAIEVPWVLPPVLYAILATGGSITAGLLAAFNLLVATVLWAPFVLIANKMSAE